jgi:hypothetical protein
MIITVTDRLREEKSFSIQSNQMIPTPINISKDEKLRSQIIDKVIMSTLSG